MSWPVAIRLERVAGAASPSQALPRRFRRAAWQPRALGRRRLSPLQHSAAAPGLLVSDSPPSLPLSALPHTLDELRPSFVLHLLEGPTTPRSLFPASALRIDAKIRSKLFTQSISIVLIEQFQHLVSKSKVTWLLVRTWSHEAWPVVAVAIRFCDFMSTSFSPASLAPTR